VTSQFIVSIIGNAVIEPLPLVGLAAVIALAILYLAMFHFVLPALSKRDA